MSEIIYEQWAADQSEARYFEPPYDDSPDGGTPAPRTTPRPEGTPLPADCPGCVDECHCTEARRILGAPPCEFCADLERRRPAAT